MTSTFGGIIREWRARRRFSQLGLAQEAEISARHLSFLESGRAAPSRAMVLRLAAALGLPKLVVNHALQAAGFAAVYPCVPLSSPALAPVRQAISTMLVNHDPLPAVAIDRRWQVIDANRGAAVLFSRFGDPRSINMVDLLISLGDGTVIDNWAEIAALTLSRLRAELAQLGDDPVLRALTMRLALHPRLSGALPWMLDQQSIVPIGINIGEQRLLLFSTIAQFGAVQDVFASEIRIELMFPADEDTQRFFAGTTL